MATIKTPAAGVSPYQAVAAAPTVLRAAADGTTVLATAAAAATTVSELAAANANTLVVVNGQAALNSLITSSQPGVFQGANVTINLEEQQFNTTNQVTSNTNYPAGNTGEIQYNSGDNSFASDAYFTYTNSNVLTPGIRTNGYFYANGFPFIGGGNAAIGNFVFSGDTMSISDSNQNMNITGNGTGNIQVNSNGNVWVFNNVGNLTLPSNSSSINYANGAPYGSGSNYSNSNVSSFLAAFGSNVVSTTGNVTAGYFIGNGSQLTGVVSSYGNANVVANLAALGSNPVSTTGNVTGGNLLFGTGIVSGTGNISGNYFIGNGSQLTGILSSLPLANGTSNIDIATANGNVTITANGSPTWTFKSDGNLTLPTAGNIVGAVNIIGNGTGNVNVIANSRAWTFAADGNLTLPSNTSSINYANGDPYGGSGSAGAAGNAGDIQINVAGNIGADSTLRYVDNSGEMTLYADYLNAPGIFTSDIYAGDGSPSNLTITTNYGNATWTFKSDGNLTLPTAGNIVGAVNIIGNGTGNVNVIANSRAWTFAADGNLVLPLAGNIVNYGNTWNFGLDGNLTLPGNIIAINYANGNRVTGNITFRDEIVIGTGTSNLISGLYLAPSSSSADANMYLRVRGNINDEPTHIHFDTGNNQYYNQFIGDDNKYIQLANTGNIVINSNDVAGNAAQWTFAADGNLTFPTGNLVITPDLAAEANAAVISSTDHVLALVSNGVNGGVQSVWVEDIANIGTSNIAAVRVSPVSQTGNVQIQTGNNSSYNTWTFSADGNLTLPSSLIVPANSIITGVGASPAPSINGFNTINAITFSASGNVTSGNVLTGGVVKTGSFVTGTIPAAAGIGAGARAFVTDADSIIFGNLYVGGAANAMPVWSNGTNWYIG